MVADNIEHLPPGRLRPWAGNARTHSRKQVRQIADSIRTFGFTNPVLIDGSMTILAGHGRVEAARQLGLETVPCLRLDHMSETEKRAYVLADNKLALNAGWDEELLAAELGALLEMEGLDFEVSVTGFSIPEIDGLIEGVLPEEDGDTGADHLPPLDEKDVICRPGYVWQMGRHRLVCGDSLDPSVVELLMDGEQARMVFTEPPYNVPIKGHVSGLGKVRHREFAMASGEMSGSQFAAFLQTALQNMADHSMDGSIHYVCMDWRHMQEVLSAGLSVHDEVKNLVVWAKDNGGMGAFYRSRHELVFVFKLGTAPHVNAFELGQHGRYRTNVWEYRGVNTMKAGRMDELALHPTVKPVQMIADAIRDVSHRNDIVLDLFGGSGSTLIAAEKTGRRAFLVELDPVYCDRIIRRWETRAKDDAVLLACGIGREQSDSTSTSLQAAE
jgi:DNA modification methylase